MTCLFLAPKSQGPYLWAETQAEDATDSTPVTLLSLPLGFLTCSELLLRKDKPEDVIPFAMKTCVVCTLWATPEVVS